MTLLATPIDFAARGEEILRFADSADQADWEAKWVVPESALGSFDTYWKFAPTFRTDDFKADLGFFVDALGFDILTVSAATATDGEPYAMFFLAGEDVTFALTGATTENPAPPSDSFSLEFMIKDIGAAIEKARARGAKVSDEPRTDDHNMGRAELVSPSGIRVSLWSTNAC